MSRIYMYIYIYMTYNNIHVFKCIIFISQVCYLHFVISSINKYTYFNIRHTTLVEIFYLQICECDAYERIHFNSDTP